MKRIWPVAFSIFLFAFALRMYSVWPANTIIGFDQARDLFAANQIIQGDLKIIGPTAGNNPSLRHGVAFWYFLIPPLLLGRDPIWPVLWNSLFNAATTVILFSLAKALFDSERAGIIAATLAAISFYFVQFSGWLSNPTVTLFTTPVFFYGIWKYYQKKTWGLPLAMFFLGLSIQFELFFIYLIPTGLILWLVLRPKFPSLKLAILSLVVCLLSLSTIIATETKFSFAGIKSLASAGSFVGGVERTNFFKQFGEKFFLTFANTLLPTLPYLGVVIAVFLILFLILKRRWFLLIYLVSPILMLLLGYHNAPWFLIGLPPAIILAAAFVLAKLKNFLLFPLLLILALANISSLKTKPSLLEPDPSAILTKQIAAIDYTYQKSAGKPFAIDTITNPLYINAVWAWNYDWYATKYDFKPGWLGGDQLPPYDTLAKATGKEKYFFLIIDTTERIPPVYTQNAIVSMAKKADFVEAKDFESLRVLVFQAKP